MRFVIGTMILGLSTTAFAGVDVGEDHAELGADGVLTITGKRPAKITVGAGVLKIAKTRTTNMIVVETPKEAIVVASDGKPWKIAGRFPIGPAGLDGDFAYAIDATPNGLVRFQQLPGVSRCDGKPAYLFAELFDPASGKLAKVVPPSGIDPNATKLVAKLDAAPAGAPVMFRAQIASAQGASDAGGLSIPSELDDGKLDTVWTESVGGNGRGHLITFHARSTIPARQIRIVPGNPRSQDAMRNVHRPARLGVVTKDGAFWLEIPDPSKEPLGAAYSVELPQPASCVTIVLDGVHAGANDTTAIAELEIFAEGERNAGAGEAMLARVIAEGQSGYLSVVDALAQRGASGVKAIEDALGAAKDSAAKRRLVLALAAFKDPSAAPLLARAATEGMIGDADLVDVITALGKLGQTAALAVVAKQTRIGDESRILAASKIDPSKADGLAALVELAGTEPRALRKAVIDTLAARAPIAKLFDAAASSAGASPDVLRALTKAARVSKDTTLRAQIVDALLQGLTAAGTYEQRYRVIDAIATLGDRAALNRLEAYVKALPASTETAALRQVAIRAVSSTPRVDAMPLVIGLAADRDPGVRLAALGVLASADVDPGGPWNAPDGPDGIDRVIISALSTDHWPEVRRRAAESLGSRCSRLGPATALQDALGKDRDATVKTGALSALVQCKAANIVELLARLYDDGKAPIGLRVHAVDETVILADASLAKRLVGKLAGWRAAAIESKEALELAQHAAVAIGRLAPPGAAEALLAALDDSAYPEIVTAAALGIGQLGPACPPSAKAKLLAIAKEEENLATVAKRAAAQCGH